MDYAERVLHEVIETFANMDSDEYEQIYNSAINKWQQNEYSMVSVSMRPKEQSISCRSKTVQYSPQSKSVDSVTVYTDSPFERTRAWAA